MIDPTARVKHQARPGTTGIFWHRGNADASTSQLELIHGPLCTLTSALTTRTSKDTAELYMHVYTHVPL